MTKIPYHSSQINRHSLKEWMTRLPFSVGILYEKLFVFNAYFFREIKKSQINIIFTPKSVNIGHTDAEISLHSFL